MVGKVLKELALAKIEKEKMHVIDFIDIKIKMIKYLRSNTRFSIIIL